MFYDNFVKACISHNKTPSSVAIDIGISKATVTGWKKGATPTDATLHKLADYFGISPTDLSGESRLKVSKGEVIHDGDISMEALTVARAYDRADKRSKDMVRLALEPFGLSAASEEAM